MTSQKPGDVVFLRSWRSIKQGPRWCNASARAAYVAGSYRSAKKRTSGTGASNMRVCGGCAEQHARACDGGAAHFECDLSLGLVSAREAGHELVAQLRARQRKPSAQRLPSACSMARGLAFVSMRRSMSTRSSLYAKSPRSIAALSLRRAAFVAR
jgi:hypothetical protein